jgi:hypothetical protein
VFRLPRNGDPLDVATSVVVFGYAGTRGRGGFRVDGRGRQGRGLGPNGEADGDDSRWWGLAVRPGLGPGPGLPTLCWVMMVMTTVQPRPIPVVCEGGGLALARSSLGRGAEGGYIEGLCQPARNSKSSLSSHSHQHQHQHLHFTSSHLLFRAGHPWH